jgi:hypothetical protein
MTFAEKVLALLAFIPGGAFVSANYEHLRDALGMARALIISGLAICGVYFFATRIVVNSTRRMFRSRRRNPAKPEL